MQSVTLIQCTDSKRDEPAPAKDFYDRPWYILSAKHGLVPPGRRLTPYDERGISKEQAREIAMELWEHGFDTVHVTAGRDYTRHLIPALEERQIDVVNHFAGERIGDRQRLLQQAVEGLDA